MSVREERFTIRLMRLAVASALALSAVSCGVRRAPEPLQSEAEPAPTPSAPAERTEAAPEKLRVPEPDPVAMALQEAVLKGDVGKVGRLLDEGTAPDTIIESTDGGVYTGFTALHVAAGRGDRAMVEVLLERDASPGFPMFPSGNSPLHIAAGTGHVDVARLLLEAGADPNEQAKFSTTPMDRAVDSGSEEMVRLLVEYGGVVEEGGRAR